MSAVGGDGGDERIQLVFLLLQFLHQTLNGPFGERLALAALPVTHQTVHNAQTGVVTGGRVCDGHPRWLSASERLPCAVSNSFQQNTGASERSIQTAPAEELRLIMLTSDWRVSLNHIACFYRIFFFLNELMYYGNLFQPPRDKK